MRPRLLDLFCGAGGATKGYQRAGFYVVGVDVNPQPNYCGEEFVQADVLDYLDVLIRHRLLGRFSAIHASPPCQHASTLRHRTGEDYENLIPQTRELLNDIGLPYVIENVMGAELVNPIRLCGSSFGLGANGRQLRRHRLFECSGFSVMAPPCAHRGQPVGVYGTGGGGQMTRGYKGTPEEYREAMGIDWATRAEIAQAIPPAYTKYVGEYLMAAIS